MAAGFMLALSYSKTFITPYANLNPFTCPAIFALLFALQLVKFRYPPVFNVIIFYYTNTIDLLD